MRRVPIILIAVITTTLATTSSLAFGPPAGAPHVYKTVGERELRLYANKPADWTAADNRPAIVYFVTRGIVCFQVEYRLLDKKKKLAPITCTQDAKSAMRWIRKRSPEFGIDPQRIASAGGSAGGHLAAFIGCVDGGDAPGDDTTISAKSNAMLLFNPVYDNGPGEWGAARVKDRVQEFSPAHNLTADDPPSIVFLGSKDKLIPVATAEKFRDASRAVGTKSELHVYEGQGHGFFNPNKDTGRWFKATARESDLFLGELGWIEGEPAF